MDHHQHHLTSFHQATSSPEVAHNTPASAPVNCAESLSVPPLGVGSLPDAEAWLLASAHIGPNTRPARLALAALRSTDDHRACDEAVIWLARVAFSDDTFQSARWAAEILEAVA